MIRRVVFSYEEYFSHAHIFDNTKVYINSIVYDIVIGKSIYLCFMAILNNCGEIFYAELPACASSFTVRLPGLLPSTEYQWYITDKFGHVYSETVTTDQNKSFVISAEDFPEGYFNPYIGFLELEVKKHAYYCETMIFNMCDGLFDRILISFKEGNIPAIIPCLC